MIRWIAIWLICLPAFAQNINVTNLPIATGFAPTDSLLSLTNSHMGLVSISNILSSTQPGNANLTNWATLSTNTLPQRGTNIQIVNGTVNLTNTPQFDGSGVTNINAANVAGNGIGITNLIQTNEVLYFQGSVSGVTPAGSYVTNYEGADASTYSNILTDIFLGSRARGYFYSWYTVPGDLVAQLFVNATHDGVPPAASKGEFQLVSANNIAVAAGYFKNGNGHIQVGGGNTDGYGGNNLWTYMQDQGPVLAQSFPTGFSAGLTFKSSALLGANQDDEFPGIFSYYITTNSPGTWALALSPNVMPGKGGDNSWDPNRAVKPLRVFGGASNSVAVDGIFSTTNIYGNGTLQAVFEAGQTKWLNTMFFSNVVVHYQNASGRDEMQVWPSSHAVILNNGNADGTYLDIHDNSATHWFVIDPNNVGGFVNGGGWCGGSFTFGAKNAAAQKLDVIGTMAVSSTVYLTNLTASRVVLTDVNKALTSAAASGPVPMNADGSATTGNQLRGFITNHIIGKSYALIAQNITSFWAPQGNAVTNIQTSDVDMQSRQAIGTGFQVVGIWVKASQAAGVGQNYTITVMTNGVATALAPSISGASATTASQFTSPPIVEAQGDSIGIKIVTSATATTNTRFDWDVMYINQ